jgi:hypothetical protein
MDAKQNPAIEKMAQTLVRLPANLDLRLKPSASATLTGYDICDVSGIVLGCHQNKSAYRIAEL